MRQTFLQGTLILIVAGMITRFLGFINRLVVARLMGEEGIGLYMMALPTLFLMITLSQIGLPIAISKRISEATALGQTWKIKQIMIVAITLTSLLSISLTVLIFLGTPLIAEHLFTDERTIFPLMAMAPAIPLITLTSVLRGYFQGKHNMKPQSYALIIEQVVRITAVVICVKIALPYGVEFAAAAAMISLIIGEISALIFMVYQFHKYKNIILRKQFFSQFSKGKQTMKELFSIALPTTGSRLINSISSFIEPILIVQCLAFAGFTTTVATKQYGELMGYALPLLFLPTFITNSLSIALIPTISEAEAKNLRSMIHFRIHQAIRLSFASGAIATVIISIFAVPILKYMYGTSDASKFLIFMAPFYLLLYFQAPLQATLQALDLAKFALKNSIIGILVKLVVLIFLTSHPSFGMMGVAIAMSIHVVLMTLLHLSTLYQEIQFKIATKDLFKMGLLVFLSWQVSLFAKTHYLTGNGSIVYFLLIISLLVIIYLLLLFVLRFIKINELKQIPFFNKIFT